MVIVSQYFRNAKRSQRNHRAAVSQAVSLIGPSLVERQRRNEVRGSLCQDSNRPISHDAPNGCAYMATADRPGSREPSQQLRQDLFGCNKLSVEVCDLPGENASVPGVFRI